MAGELNIQAVLSRPTVPVMTVADIALPAAVAMTVAAIARMTAVPVVAAATVAATARMTAAPAAGSASSLLHLRGKWSLPPADR